MSRGSRFDERLEILNGTEGSAALPLERRLAPPYKPEFIRIEAHEDPVTHLRVDNPRCDLNNIQAK